MNFSISQLVNALEGFELRISERDLQNRVVFTRVELSTTQPYETSVLYILNNTECGVSASQTQLLWRRDGEDAPGGAMVLNASCAQVSNAIARYTERLEHCLDAMRNCYYAEKDLQGFCQALSDFVGNPVVAYDSSLLPVAQSLIERSVAIELFGHEKADEAFVLRTIPDWKRVGDEDVFTHVGARRISNASGSQQTAAVNVLFKGEFQGYLEIFEVYRPITDAMMVALDAAAQIAAMSPYSFEESGFLINTLEGRLVKGELTSSWFSALHWEEGDPVYVVAVCSPETGQPRNLTRDHVVRMLRLLLPYSVSQQMGEMLVSVVNGRFIKRDSALDKVSGFLAELGAPANVGASEIMRGVGRLHEGYEHAEFAARTSARKKRGAVKFEECRFLYLSELCGLQENVSLIADARVIQMHADDVSDGTDNVETLQAFMETGFNLSAAAEMLHVHRNTVTYRLRRIKEVYGVDLTPPIHDKDAVLLLLLSCRLVQQDEG